MINTIIEKIVKASSDFGDLLGNPMSSIDKLFHAVTIGSIPERSKSGCDDQCEFCNKLHNIEMGRDED